jgi:hypothetical protein
MSAAEIARTKISAATPVAHAAPMKRPPKPSRERCSEKPES